MEVPSIHCEVRTEPLDIVHMNLMLEAVCILLYVFQDAT